MTLRMIAVGLAVMVLLAGCGAPGPGANDTTPDGEETPTEEDGLLGTETTAENGTATGTETATENGTATPTGTETPTEGGMEGS